MRESLGLAFDDCFAFTRANRAEIAVATSLPCDAANVNCEAAMLYVDRVCMRHWLRTI